MMRHPFEPSALEVQRPEHHVTVHSRAMEYTRGLVVAEWRWMCQCGAVGPWESTLLRAMVGGDRHLDPL